MKIGIIYWSGTGRTEAIAEVLKSAAEAKGHAVDASSVEDFSGTIGIYDAIFLGCSSQGAEELEEDVFAPFYDAVKPELAGKDVGLFGSYGWGDGEWMRNWVEDAKDAGITVLSGEGLICQEDEDTEEACISYMNSVV